MRRSMHRFTASLIASVATAAFSLPAGAQCPTAAPQPLTPGPDQAVSSPVELSWTEVDYTDEYLVFIYDDITGSDVHEESVTTTAVSVSLPVGSYGWVVNAITSDCTVQTSEDSFFSVPPSECPSPPVLLAPEEESVHGGRVRFEWSPIDGASFYLFELFRDGALFEERELEGTAIELDLPQGTYDWTIVAAVPGCGFLESEFSYFFVRTEACPEAGPELISPGLFEEVSSPVTFSWEPIPGVTSYFLYVEDNDEKVVFDDFVTGTSMVMELPPNEYYWDVSPDASGCPFVGTDSVFRVSCGRGAPELTAPADGASADTPVTFSWSGVPGVEGYYVVAELFGEVYLDEFTDETTLTVTLPSGEITWFVEAVYADCPPEASSRRDLTVTGGADCPITTIELLTPGADSTVTSTPVSFSWTPVDGAFEYWVLIAEAQDEFFELEAYTDQPSASIPIGPGEYEWLVIALIEGCPPIESAIGSFSFPGDPDCQSETPELVAPVDDAILGNTVRFEWSSVPDVSSYVVMLESLEGYPQAVATTTETSLTLQVDSGEYFWWVVAFPASCAPAESEDRYFEIPDSSCDTESPYLLSPIDDAEDVASPVFEWSPVDGASQYQVWIAVDGGEFTPLATPTTESRLEGGVPPGEIEWFVEVSFVNGCPSELSEVQSFESVADSSECNLTARPRISSIGSITAGETYTLYWTSVPGAAAYEIEESRDESFLTAEKNRVDATSASFRHDDARQTEYHYRVRAIDSCGRSGPVSLRTTVVVEPRPATTASSIELIDAVADLDPLTTELFIPGSGSSPTSGKGAEASSTRRRGARRTGPPAGVDTFSISASVPWLSATPSSGTLPPSGVTVQVTIDPRKLRAGSFDGSVTVTRNVSGATESATTTIPVSTSLVTPVSSGESSALNPQGAVIPIRGGAAIVSNVEISNLSPVQQTYEIEMTPAGANGFRSARKTTLHLEPGRTLALDELLETWFGFERVEGLLAIRPQENRTSGSNPDSSSFLSSSLNVSVGGERSVSSLTTAIPYGQFLSSRDDSTLILPLLPSTGEARTVKLFEGAGQQTTALIRVVDAAGAEVGSDTVGLSPFEQLDLSSLLGGITSAGGRVEIGTTSGSGRVSGVVSSRLASSGDERVVTPRRSDTSARDRIVVGVAGGAQTSSLWLHNPGETQTSATIRYFGTSVMETTVQLDAGGTVSWADLATLFPLGQEAGVLRIVSDSPLIASGASTRSVSGIITSSILPVLGPDQTARLREKSIHILHGEASAQRTTTVGIAEIDGRPVKVELRAIVPGALAAVSTTLDLQAHEVRTLPDVLSTFGLSRASSVRLILRVREGSGRIAAFSMLTTRDGSDMTIVPAR